MKKEKLKLREGVRTFLIIAGIYILFIMYLLYASTRITGLDQNSYTEAGKNKSINIMEIFKR